MTQEMKFFIEVVEWVDASYEDAPMSFRKPSPLIRLINVGFLVHEDDERIVLATDLDLQWETMRHQVAIPKVCISKREVIKILEEEP